MQSPGSSLSVVRVETTAQDTFEREAVRGKRPVIFKSNRELDSDDDTWMFPDGSSTGWHALVVLRPGQDPRLFAREIQLDTRNVGAEMSGLLMALERLVPGERVAIVADFLWSIYYVLGWRNVRHPALQEQVAAARALLDARRPASLRYIHIRGHERDASAFGRWTHVADRLCALRRPIDLTAPISAFGEPGARPRSLDKILAEVAAKGGAAPEPR